MKFKVKTSCIAYTKPGGTEEFSHLTAGQVVSGKKGQLKTVKEVKWREVTIKKQKVWVKAKNLKKITPNYRKEVLKNAKSIYKEIIKLKCKHQGGAKSLKGIRKKHITTCATSVSAVLQESGMMSKGELLSHTSAVGSSKATSRKHSKKKAISGLSNLKKGTYKIHWVGKSWNRVPDKYKIPGAVIIQDSNIAIYKGNGKFYSTNNGGSQKKNGKYVSNIVSTKSYCGTSPVLYIIIPNKGEE